MQHQSTKDARATARQNNRPWDGCENIAALSVSNKHNGRAANDVTPRGTFVRARSRKAMRLPPFQTALRWPYVTSKHFLTNCLYLSTTLVAGGRADCSL